MTNDEFDTLYDSIDELQNLHCDYIYENCCGDRVISNGKSLLKAIEDGYLYGEFSDAIWLVVERNPEMFK
jgi:hypothetical protein